MPKSKLAEILIVFRIEECKESPYYESSDAKQFRMQVAEVKQFYASLFLLRSRCIEVDDEQIPLPGSTAEEENSTSDRGCQMRVLLRHDKYQALGELLDELPIAVEQHRKVFIFNGYRYTPQFQRTYAARECNSTTTWIDGGIMPVHQFLSIFDTQVEELESFLLAAKALLRLFCETVANFEVLWLKCLNALSNFCSTPETRTDSLSSLLRAWIASPQYWTSYSWSGISVEWAALRAILYRTCYRRAASLNRAKRLLQLHLISSIFSKNGAQPHSYFGARVSAIYRGGTNMDSTRKELPMIIGGKEIKSQHDSGAERGNFMDCDLASKLNLRLRTEKGDCKRFSMGNGKIVKALGRVRAVCAFAKEAQTKMKCWFYVFDELASPLIMGSHFLEKTKTLSDHVHRLEDCIPKPGIVPMVNLIGSTQHAKRRFTAYIDHRYTLINADSGSDLDLMSSTYVRAHGYRLDRRRRCRKRVRFADNTMAETIGQVQATLTLEDGSTYSKTFDILPKLTSDVLLGQFTLEEIKAFQLHRRSFVNVFAGERHLELSVLGYLGKVNEFLACKLRRVHRRRSLGQNQGKLLQYTSIASDLPLIHGSASLAKQQDDDLMEVLQAQDLEAERLHLQSERFHLQNERSAASTTTPEVADGDGGGSEPVQSRFRKITPVHHP